MPTGQGDHPTSHASKPLSHELWSVTSSPPRHSALHPLLDTSEEMRNKVLGFPALDDMETLGMWLGAPSLVHDSSRTFLDGHRAGKRVFEKLSLCEPITSTDDVGYMLNDFTVDRKYKSKRQNIDGVVRDDGVLRIEMAPRRPKVAQPAELTRELAAKPMFAALPLPRTDLPSAD